LKKIGRLENLDFFYLLKINDLNYPLTLTLSPRERGQRLLKTDTSCPLPSGEGRVEGKMAKSRDFLMTKFELILNL
jgi:hypothetical protein